MYLPKGKKGTRERIMKEREKHHHITTCIPRHILYTRKLTYRVCSMPVLQYPL